MSLYKNIKTQKYGISCFIYLFVLFFDLSVPEKNVLISPNAVIDFSISPFSSVSLGFLYC